MGAGGYTNYINKKINLHVQDMVHRRRSASHIFKLGRLIIFR